MNRNPFVEWESAVSNTVAGLIGLIVLISLIVAIAIVVVLLTEVWRVYRTRAFGQSTATARYLYVALAVLLGIWSFAVWLAGDPGLAPAGSYIASWAFLIFVIFVEGADYFARGQEERLAPDGLSLGRDVTA
jgi:hypothetical protein